MLVTSNPITDHAKTLLTRYHNCDNIELSLRSSTAYVIDVGNIYDLTYRLIRDSDSSLMGDDVYNLFQVIMEIYVSNYLHIADYDSVSPDIYMDDMHEQIIIELEMIYDTPITTGMELVLQVVSKVMTICDNCIMLPDQEQHSIRTPLLWSKSNAQTLLHVIDFKDISNNTKIH